MSEQQHETKRAIMEATLRALCEHGYADLTMADIADEFDKSQAAIHYHFETKEDLVVAFLQYSQRRIAEELAAAEGDTAAERMEATLDFFISGPEPVDASDIGDFHTALLELQAQSPSVDAYRRELEEIDAAIRAHYEAIVEDGIGAGEFEAVDPAAVAEEIVTLLSGARVRAVALDDDAILEHARTMIEDELLRRIAR
jgi:AcrR family transcriptional regulator